MTDLSGWDFAVDFTPFEAAALILGLMPNSLEATEEKIKPVFDRLKVSYEPLPEWYLGEFEAAPKFNIDHQLDDLSLELAEFRRVLTELIETKRRGLSSGLIESCELEDVRLWANTHFDVEWIYTWASSGNSDFQEQRFTRAELFRWLTSNNLKSVYRFDLDQSLEISKTGDRWPWGSHHTDLLGHLEAAARRYWGALYDPSDATTAPTNTVVSEWLQNERKVSRNMADSIASILRQDGLPTGPRK